MAPIYVGPLPPTVRVFPRGARWIGPTTTTTINSLMTSYQSSASRVVHRAAQTIQPGRSPFMRRVPSVGFSLDATAPVPNRTLPRQAKPASPQPQQSSDEPAATGRQSPPRNNVPLAEHLEGQSPALRIVLLALAAGFKEVGGRLRYGLRMPSGLDASVDAHRVEAAGDVGRLDRAVGHFLVEALSKTGVCCTIALETHEGLVEVPCGPGWVRGGARVWASSRCSPGPNP